MTDPIYRTLFQVEVFSNGPFLDYDLDGIDYAITYGECIGDVTRVSSEPVDPSDIEAHLLRIGNDGTFFDDALEDL